MTDRGMFVLFDLGETLVDLTDLVGRIADRLRREIRGMEQDAEKTSHDWIRRTSASLPREEGTPFVREIDVAATVLRELLAARGIPITESDADALLRRAWNDLEPSARPAGGRGGRHEDGATSEGTPFRIREASTACAATIGPPAPARHPGQLVEGTPRCPVTWP